ncbi:MAG TPA: sigma-70 family RNA polymerase sigma factor [Bacteroidetes bacterium]|nr:sigma-70 family RNA polymerase sigma factor [Bacteroidota bacterium]
MQTPIWPDEKIMDALKSGATSRNRALRYVFEKLDWKGLATGYILNNGGNETDATEIANDTLIFFDRNIRNGLFNGNCALKTYFLAIAKRQWWKQQKRKKGFDELDPQRHDQTEENAEDYILQKEKMQFLQLATAVLGEKCKKVFRLKQLGYSGADMAEELGLKNAAMAKKALYRCRQNFKQYLKDHPQWRDLLNR